jgi:hypothetical protein
VFDVDPLPDDTIVPDIGLALRCPHCGSPAIETRPDWREAVRRMGLGAKPRRVPTQPAEPTRALMLV